MLSKSWKGFSTAVEVAMGKTGRWYRSYDIVSFVVDWSWKGFSTAVEVAMGKTGRCYRSILYRSLLYQCI